MKKFLVLAGLALLASTAAFAQQYEYRYSKEGGGPNFPPPTTCSAPWGGGIADGGSVQAYASANVAFGVECIAETRTCTEGALSGSFAFHACEVEPGLSCDTPWGGTVGHDGAVEAFLQEDVAWNQTCSSQLRECYNGTLSGSYSFGECEVALQDTTPAAFAFTAQSGLNPGVSTLSNIVQILDVDGSIPVSVTGPSAEFRTCGNATCSSAIGAWSTSGQVANAQYLQMRMPSNASLSGLATATLSAGSFSASWALSTASTICNAITSPTPTGERFNTVSQQPNDTCQFSLPQVAPAQLVWLTPDVQSGELYCRRVMGPDARLAGLTPTGIPNNSNPVGVSRNGTSFISIETTASRASTIRCTSAPTGCGSGEWFDGSQCRPVPTVWCGQIISDADHQFEEKHYDVGIGRCVVGRIRANNYYAYDGSTLLNFVATLQGISNGVIESAIPYSGTGNGYLLWRAPGPKTSLGPGNQATIYVNIADPNYGSAGTLPGDIPGY